MAFSIAARRIAAAVAPSATTALRRLQKPRLALLPLLSRTSSFTPATRHHFASFSRAPDPDARLLRLIDSTMNSVDKAIYDQVPFENQEDQGPNVVTLRKSYLNETVEVVAKKGYSLYLTVAINISKGEESSLLFDCTVAEDELTINTIDYKCKKDPEERDDFVGGISFNDLDENLQEAFHKYLGQRGISDTMLNSLYSHMMNKSGSDRSAWLSNVKHFIEK